MATDQLTGLPVDWRDPRGYVRLRFKGHPLSDARGRLGRHRLVLWRHLGSPTETPCNHCGYVLPWHSSDPKTSIGAAYVNGRPGDDRVENLIPTCSWCRLNQWVEDLFGEAVWRRLINQWSATSPVDRPNPNALMESCHDQWFSVQDPRVAA